MDYFSLKPTQTKLYFTFILLCFLLIPSSSTTNTTDYLTLLSFKSLISDPLRSLTSWNSDNSSLLCHWQGVTCSNVNHPLRVTSLKLSSMNFTGNIPPSLSNLTFLATLDLSYNSFHGLIPPEFGRLRYLQHLNLSFNSLDREIPASLSNCSNLQNINLYTNLLVGTIPPEIGSLANLLSVDFGVNNLYGGIPPSFGNMSYLKSLLLLGAGVEGRIPDSLGKLTSLKIFQVAMNRLLGEIPSSLYNLSSMQYFVAGGNHLVGTLPFDMFDTLPNLQMVLLYGNGFHGSIPASLPNASKLVELDFRENNFSGMIPSDLGKLKNLYWVNLNSNSFEAEEPHGWDFLTSLVNCTRLGTLGLGSNKLGGILPSSVANLSSHLDILVMGENQIGGTIPDGIGNLANLSVLILNGNHLTGPIPSSIGKLRKLYALRLSGNSFSGQIPASFGNLTQLDQLDLRACGVEGSIPASFGNCRSLNKVDFSQNKLSGVIPKELVSIPYISIVLDLSNNFLTGDLPSEVSQMVQLSAFDISHNQLSGEIPSSLGDCESLEFLYMQDNLFNGTIPQTLGKLKGLSYLDLSSNNLSGLIPGSLTKLNSLLYLNLSLNDLEGDVPKDGIFVNASGISVTGNRKLCGGVPQLHLPSCYTPSSTNKGLSNTLKVVISAASSVACLIIVLLITVIFILRRRKKSRTMNLPVSPVPLEFKQISYVEIARATNGFSPSNLIGSGGFGSVYKGILDSYEKIVAMKVFNLGQRGASKSFLAECEVLRNIRHRNLVRILTACSTVDSQGNDFKALVLEFMSNGSLEQWLYPEGSEVSNLSFVQRLNIAIDVAFALDYLHNQTERPIVHCDLKPSNVLLDEDMSAHLSDFGLASFLSDEFQTSSFGIKGSIGYIAPEYGIGNQLSTNGDVFSYGVLLLEMFTRKRPTDPIFTSGVGLHSYIEKAFPDRVLTVVDAYILPQGNNHSEAKGKYLYGMEEGRMLEQECLFSVLRIGLACSEEDPGERMDLRSVIKELCAVRELLLDN